MVVVYIASPYENEPTRGPERQKEAANIVLDLGAVPIWPLANVELGKRVPRVKETWLKIDEVYVRISDIVWRLEGESEGADKECVVAHTYGIWVVYSYEQLCAALQLLQHDERVG